jgi:hypothetical protein
MTDAAKVLNDAADLIEPEGRWTKRCLARDDDGIPVWPEDPAACSWCVEGAISRVAPSWPLKSAAFVAVRAKIHHEGIDDWNDAQPGPESVVAVLRAAAQAVTP